jgi:hypothetical protein
MAAILPEYVIYAALEQFIEARRASESRNRFTSKVDTIEVSAISSPHDHCPKSRQDLEPPKREQWTLEHGYFVLMGGLELKSKHLEADIPTIGRTLTVKGVLRLAELGILPNISLTTIRQRSKSSFLAKGLVCLQVSWMLIQTIARKIAGLPVTLIELNTLVHVGCTIAVYTVWWFKPQDVDEPIIIDVTECAACNALLKETPSFYSTENSFWVEESSNEPANDGNNRSPVGLLVVLNLAYGGIHAAAWNAHFPSVLEQNFWRAAVCLVVSGVLGMVCKTYSWDRKPGMPMLFITLLCMVVYFVARLFLITEAFISVRSLPIGAYDTVNWPNFLPHIG